MAAYISQQDLIDYLDEQEVLDLADRDGDGTPDSAVIDQAIDKATGEIDAAVCGRYSVPLTYVDGFVRRIALDLARYYLYDDEPTDRVRIAYETARGDLDAVAEGRRLLAGAEPAAGDATPQWNADERWFTRQTLRDYG